MKEKKHNIIQIQSLNIKKIKTSKSHEFTFMCETTTTEANDRSYT